MDWQYTPYLFPVLGAGLISIGLAVIAWRRRTTIDALAFMAMMLAVGYWSLVYAVELSIVDLGAKIFLSKVMYLGIAATPTTWLIFALYHTGFRHWFSRSNWWWWLIEPALIIGLAWTNDIHRLIWTANRLEPAGPIVVQVVDHGPLFWVHAIYSYVSLALGSFLMIRSTLGAGRLMRSQTVVMLVSISFPWIGNALYLSGLSPSNLDLTPFAFTLTGIGMTGALFRFGLLEIVPIARSRVVDSISDGVLVIDSDHRVVDLNPAAADAIGRPLAELIGRPSTEVLHAWHDLVARYWDVQEAEADVTLQTKAGPRLFNIRISPLSQIGTSGYRLVLLRDVTQAREVEERVRRQALAFANIADSVIITDLDGVIVDCNPATERLFGWTCNELIGKSARLWHRPEQSEALTEEILEALRTADRWEGEIEAVRKDGAHTQVEVIVVPLRNERGKRIASIGVSRDISHRKRAEPSR